jgi:hypothetical protein
LYLNLEARGNLTERRYRQMKPNQEIDREQETVVCVYSEVEETKRNWYRLTTITRKWEATTTISSIVPLGYATLTRKA